MAWQDDWVTTMGGDNFIYYAGETPNPQLNPRLWQWVLKDGKWKGFTRLDPDVFRVRVKS